MFLYPQAGLLYIKVKRDADKQLVLHQVTSKLAGHVTHLTVHITKDEWSVSPMASHSGSTLNTKSKETRNIEDSDTEIIDIKV